MLALNTVYNERENRNILKAQHRRGGDHPVSGAVRRGDAGAGGGAAGGAARGRDRDPVTQWIVTLVKWPVLIAAVILALGAF